MGGCCCTSRKAQSQRTPVYYYEFEHKAFEGSADDGFLGSLSFSMEVPSNPSLCPPSLEEQNLRSYSGTASGLPTGLLVGLNLDTSSPDTFRPPPAPIPFNVLFGRPQTPIHALGSEGPKCDAARQSKSAPIRENAVADNSDMLTPGGHVAKANGKTLADILFASPPKSDGEISKPSDAHQLANEEEDGCPICLEEYDTDNPKMLTNCEHDFHLSCLLEWMERSDCCPVCDKEMIFDYPVDQI